MPDNTLYTSAPFTLTRQSRNQSKLRIDLKPIPDDHSWILKPNLGSMSKLSIIDTDGLALPTPEELSLVSNEHVFKHLTLDYTEI
jgi:hypothetical protein